MRIGELIKEYKYAPLPAELSTAQRAQYLEELPSIFKIDGDENCELYCAGGTKISNGYNRIVIGDYGAYIEFTPSQAAIENFIVAPGEEYRLDERYRSTVKYYWLCPKLHPEIKIYFQQKPVDYADYRPLMFYISPYEVGVKKNEEED